MVALIPMDRSEPALSSPPESTFARLAPLVEGGLLALLVMIVITLGGETVRTSYHGYLQVSVGDAVLRDGLLPENPYHAGSGLRYYTLYPGLGVLLGRLGLGPLWGFALLNLLAAALFAPALDSLGKSLRLGVGARRMVFLFAVLGFNGLGWFGALQADGGLAAAMAVDGGYLPPLPLLSLLPMTFPDTAFAWDGRLQAFLPKFLNVSSFALAVPFALLALAWCLRERRDAAWRAGLCAGIAVALNPLVGAWSGLLVALRWTQIALRDRAVLPVLLRAAALGLAVALPFLLTAFRAAGDADWSAHFAYRGTGPWADLLGPLALLLPLGVWGLWRLPKSTRSVIGVAALLAGLGVFLELPADNGYKFSRIGGIVWALPAGVALATFARRPLGALCVAALLLLCVPTTVRAFQAYRNWDASASLPLRDGAGYLELVDERADAWPDALAAAEAALPDEAVLVFHPRHPATRVGGALASLGNALAPLLRHPLYVDLPQSLNATEPDLLERLDRVHALWEGYGYPLDAQTQPKPFAPDVALRAIRESLPERGFAVVSFASHLASAQLFPQSGASLLVEQAGMTLWWFPPLAAADAD